MIGTFQLRIEVARVATVDEPARYVEAGARRRRNGCRRCWIDQSKRYRRRRYERQVAKRGEHAEHLYGPQLVAVTSTA